MSTPRHEGNKTREIGSALTTALGFAVLVFSPIPPMGQFGLLTAITVLYSLIAAIVVLPPMLVIWAAYHDWRIEHLTHVEAKEAAEHGFEQQRST